MSKGGRLFGPLLMDIVTELGHGPDIERLKKELIRGACVQQELAILQSRLIAEANQRLEGRVWDAPGGIRLVARYHQFHHKRFQVAFGEDCWEDEDFWKDTLEKNPWMRVDYQLPLRIVVDGFRERSDKANGADENSACGRAQDHVNPLLVPCIKHSSASAREATE